MFDGYSQNTILSGRVKDSQTGESLIGANVVLSNGKGTVTDFGGMYSITSENGNFVLTVSYVGYQPQTQNVVLSGPDQFIEFMMKTKSLAEVEIVANFAQTRETPVAFTNIPSAKLNEELGSRDLPMVLNSTPGVYATEQGGGSGDSRISIRGFSQRNVAVLVDGIPVNDMENGLVYWSNWDGLGDVTNAMQVQRGLGASKLAIASVGGTINIITKGIESKARPGGVIRQETGSDGFNKTSLFLTTGRTKKGWGITIAGSRKTGDGWVDKTFTDAYSYFFKFEKAAGSHLITIGANGAPQRHGQRSFEQPIAVFDQDYAHRLGVNDTTTISHGLRYNAYWGTIDRWSINDQPGTHLYMLNNPVPGGSQVYVVNQGDTIHRQETLNERINYFHKPQIYIKDFWTISDKTFWSNIVYLSLGNGGGTSAAGSLQVNPETGQYNFQPTYNSNSTFTDAGYDPVLTKSTRILQTSINNHRWIGYLGTYNHDFSHNYTFTGGLDARWYNGIHRREVYDLLGGDYYVQPGGIDQNQPLDLKSRMKTVGDTIGYNYESTVEWGGLFSQLEKKFKWGTVFINLTGSETGYQKVDYYLKKDLVLPDTTILQAVDYNDTLVRNGVSYTNQSPEARYSTTKNLWYAGYTAKTGANYNINKNQNVYLNLGYIVKAPRLDNVFDRNNHLFKNIRSELIKAVELGYRLKYQKWAANINTYYTDWKNKPVDGGNSFYDASTDITYYYNIPGLDALHRGGELDFVYKITRQFEVEGMASVGDWIWNSADSARVYNDNEQLITTIGFSAKGVHVGNAAQSVFGGGVRYESSKNLFVKIKFTWFGRQYADFEPSTLKGLNSNRESWKVPDYSLIDLHAGYTFRLYGLAKLKLAINVFNVLNTEYISDAINNDPFVGKTSFDAAAATVFFGQGRRFTTSATISF